MARVKKENRQDSFDLEHPKYILDYSNTLSYDGRTLYKVLYYDGVEGGYLDSYRNLSQEGSCRVLDSAKVYGFAIVKEDAQITKKARVYGKAEVSGKAIVTNESQVYCLAKVAGNSLIKDTAKIADTAQVLGKAEIEGCAEINGISVVKGKSKISGNTVILNEKVNNEIRN